MIQYTTPSITLTVEGIDISSYDVYVSLEQGKVKETFSGDELAISTETVQSKTNTIIAFTLTQEQTAAFDDMRPVAVQVNWLNSDGVRAATNIKTISVMRNLLDKVIEDEN
jgi:hypothetical protein